MDWRPLYPFESHFIQLPDGQRCHYVDEGSGPVILLSHGNPTWSFYYRELIQAWSAKHRVLAVDHLGCGLSDKPQQHNYCLAGHTANLLHLIRKLDLSDITIVGHDWGGAIGLNAVRHEFDRFARIIMFNTGAFPPPRVPLRIAVCRLPLLGPLAVRGANLFARAAQHMALAFPSELSNAERAGLISPYNSWANRVAIQRFVDDIPFTRRHPTWSELANLESALPRMRSLPRLLIWGMRDWCFNEACLNRLLSHWPDANVHQIANAGHWVVEEASEQIVDATRSFFSAHPVSPRDSVSSPPSPEA